MTYEDSKTGKVEDEASGAFRDSWVYFIGSIGGPIKIGRSAKPRARLAQLQVGSATKLQLLALTPGGESEETEMHQRFAHCRLRGELYAANPELLMLIWALANGEDAPGLTVLPIADFLAACCIRRPAARARSTTVFAAYTRWCASVGEQPDSQFAFSSAMRRAGFDKIRSNGMYWVGLRLVGGDQ